MQRYENALGDAMIVVDEEYIIFDKQDLQPTCILYDEIILQKYKDAGYKLKEDERKNSLVGYCKCKQPLYETNRIKVRDYFECPYCNNISARNDLIN